jgi:hypothetical protein
MIVSLIPPLAPWYFSALLDWYFPSSGFPEPKQHIHTCVSASKYHGDSLLLTILPLLASVGSNRQKAQMPKAMAWSHHD